MSIGSLRRPGVGAGRLQTIVVLAVTIVAIGGISLYVSGGSDDGVTQIQLDGNVGIPAPTVGKPPTPFTGLTYDGKTISLSDFAGKPLWLNFGASWCRDCRVEAADFEATYEKFKPQGLTVLAVFINDPKADIARYVPRAGLTFPIIADESAKIGSAYRLVGIPTHIFIGRDGLIKAIKIGALSRDDMERAVELILQ